MKFSVAEMTYTASFVNFCWGWLLACLRQ